MFRQVRRLLLLRCSGGIARGAARSLSSDPPAAPAQDAAFGGPHKKVAPNIEPPKTTPLSPHHPPTSTSIPSKLAVNVVLPHQTELANKEDAMAAQAKAELCDRLGKWLQLIKNEEREHTRVSYAVIQELDALVDDALVERPLSLLLRKQMIVDMMCYLIASSEVHLDVLDEIWDGILEAAHEVVYADPPVVVEATDETPPVREAGESSQV